ncbi:hypothetical protein KAW65_05330 [candidate division WOR-3 bacterium]|nr:hypothetical protein [candidate division WOR-3 bacterium]
MTWNIPKINEEEAIKVSQEIGITLPFARILIFRGYKTKEAIDKFLYPSLENLRDPFEFPDMQTAVKRILLAISNREKILAWGDDDVDGMTATTLLVIALRDLGGLVDWYIPRGKIEGVGLNPEGIKKAVNQGVGLIITVDCGSSNFDLPEKPSIIITDHHEIPKGHPEAFAFINSKLGYHFSGLAGVGVAYKLAQAVTMKKVGLNAHQWFSATRNFLPLVLLGTLADKVPLIDENRVFVKCGEKEIKDSIFKKIGINKMIQLLSSTRQRTPELGIEFLFSKKEDILSELKLAKKERDDKIETVYKRCLELKSPSERIILIYADDLNPDVGGVCASRLTNKNSKPSIIIGKRPDGILLGEARAPEGFDLIDFFSKFDDCFITWGGHKMAAGFSMLPENLNEFKTRALGYTEKYFPATEKQLKIDAQVEPEELSSEKITSKFLEEIELLEPFGPANLNPLLFTKGVKKGVAKFFDYPIEGECDIIWTIKQGKPEIVEKNKTII